MTTLSRRRTAVMVGSLALISTSVDRAAAQNFGVWPPGYDQVAGNSAQATPFTVQPSSRPAGSRNATLFHGPSLPFRAGTRLDSISYRRDRVTTDDYSASIGRVTARIGRIASALQPNAANRELFVGQPCVIARTSINLPAEPAVPGSTVPAPFSVVIPFDRPWTYQGGDFAFDLDFDAQGGSTLWRRDAVWVDPQVDADDFTFGEGCTSSTGFIPQPWIDPEKLYAGGSIVLRLQGAPPLSTPSGVNLPPIVTFGVPQPPVPLDTIGLPAGCALHVFGVLSIPASPVYSPREPTRLFDEIQVQLGPLATAVPGTGLAIQWIVPDRDVNTFRPFVMSNAIGFAFGAPAASMPDWGRSYWGYDVTDVGFSYSGRIGPPNYVPVTGFSGTFQ